MNTILLYLAMVLIWGTTWIAIVWQLGVVSPLVSVAYRFSLATFIMLIITLFKRQTLSVPFRSHLLLFFQGLGAFSLNYIFLYKATQYLTSGLLSVIFSTLIIFNTIHAALFLQKPITRKHLLGIACGLVGLMILFMPDIVQTELNYALLTGIGYGFLGTYAASCAQTLVARGFQTHKIPFFTSLSLSMAYGTLCTYALVFIFGEPMNYSWTLKYNLSLLYLVVAGSVLSFIFFFALIREIGPEKAAYATTLFPVTALFLSSIFEDYSWTSQGIFSLLLIVIGNVIVLSKKGAMRALFRRVRRAKIR